MVGYLGMILAGRMDGIEDESVCLPNRDLGTIVEHNITFGFSLMLVPGPFTRFN